MRAWELPRAAVTFAEMRCDHPNEELQALYNAGTTPLVGRKLCGLCGEVTYGLGTPSEPRTRQRRTGEPRPGGGRR